jgi:hypothetical protein
MGLAGAGRGWQGLADLNHTALSLPNPALLLSLSLVSPLINLFYS